MGEKSFCTFYFSHMKMNKIKNIDPIQYIIIIIGPIFEH